MENSRILSHVDHTLLKAAASWEEICTLCEEAIEYKTASVRVPPLYIYRIAQEFPRLNICSVIGFPLGYSVVQSKLAEAEEGDVAVATSPSSALQTDDIFSTTILKVNETVH